MDLKHKIIEHTLEVEGGLSADPNDRGGLTKYGITKPFYADMKGIKVAQVKDQNIIGLTMDDARVIYSDYYDRIKAPYIPPMIQHIYFDMCVNSGQKNAAKIVQRACKDMGNYPGPIDGKIGPQTILALKRSLDQKGDRGLLEAVVKRRITFYNSIVYRDATQKKFLNGWKKRANWFLTNQLTSDPPVVHTITTVITVKPKPLGFWENLIRIFKGE